MQRRWDYRILTNLVPFFYEHFQSPAVAPGDPFLNYREALYWSKPGQEDSDTWVDCNRSVIVVFAQSSLVSVLLTYSGSISGTQHVPAT